MEQLTSLAWGLMAMVTVLALLGMAAAVFGTDSRPCVGDNHTGSRRTDWIMTSPGRQVRTQ